MTRSEADDAGTFIPGWPFLVQTVMRRCTNPSSEIHGVQHWQCVAAAGLELLRETNRGDARVVLLFALLHDCMRIHDGGDPAHGVRAAQFVRRLNGNILNLADPQFNLLYKACKLHNAGRVSDNPTVAICWDADRLNLWRIGFEPSPNLLSTEAARRSILWARDLFDQTHDWTLICEAFERETHHEDHRGSQR